MFTELLWALLKIVLAITVIWLFISYVIRPGTDFGKVQSHWHYPFDNLQFSSKEFYAKVEEAVKAKDMPNVSFARVLYGVGGIFSANREYLRIMRGNQMFLVCAAPFGSGFFVSWWHGEAITLLKDLAIRLPFVGKAFEAVMKAKTFYQLDTDTMFKEQIRACVNTVIHQITDAHGIRGLTELEQQPIDLTNRMIS